MEAQISSINDLLKNLCDNQKAIQSHLEKVDNDISQLKLSNSANTASLNQPVNSGLNGTPSVQQAHTLHSPPSLSGTAVNNLQPPVDRVGNTMSVQDEFQSIKDKLSSVKIPPELRVGTSRSGIRREDSNAANIITNSAKFVETTIKLLWNIDDNPTAENLVELFNIQKAHIEYLRQEHSGLVVAGQFGNKTSQLFKNLARGTSNLDERHLDILSKAVQITSNDASAKPPSFRGGFRGRGGPSSSYYGGGRGGGRGWQPWRGAHSGQAGAGASAVNSASGNQHRDSISE